MDINEAAQANLESECPLNNDGQVNNDTHIKRIQTVMVPVMAKRKFYRIVCTCGFVGKEHFFAFEAEHDSKLHTK